jgi:hypothetical protein
VDVLAAPRPNLSNEETRNQKNSSLSRMTFFTRKNSDYEWTECTTVSTLETPGRSDNPRGGSPWQNRQKWAKCSKDIQRREVTEESQRPWSSPIVLVRKKNGNLRFCVDYTKLNDVTQKDCFPLLRIDDTLNTRAGAK